MTSIATETEYALSKEQVAQFHRDGFVGPLTMCSPEEMATIRTQLEETVWNTVGPQSGSNGPFQCRHLDTRVTWDICSHPAIVESMASIMGPDLILWRSHFWMKEPGSKAIPWHQDYNYWPIDPTLNISAWVAIDRATTENSCVQLIPGSHRHILKHYKAEGDVAFNEEADKSGYDASKAVIMELEAGQFFLFNERTLHYSDANRSDKRRAGLAVRVTVPFVKVHHENLFKAHRNVLLRGRDYMGFNLLQDPPSA